MKIKISFILETKGFIPLFIIRNSLKKIESEQMKISNVKLKGYFKEFEKKRR